jgi:hypothetical protein
MRDNSMIFLSTGVVALFCIITAMVEFMAGSVANGCIAIAVLLLTASLLMVKMRLKDQRKIDSTLA